MEEIEKIEKDPTNGDKDKKCGFCNKPLQTSLLVMTILISLSCCFKCYYFFKCANIINNCDEMVTDFKEIYDEARNIRKRLV